MRRALVMLAVTSAVLFPAGVARAGGGCHNPETVGGGTGIAYDGFCPTPTVLRVGVGQTVTWSNKDPFEHTVTSGNGGWASETLASGAQFSHTFTTPGQYVYYCMLHPNMGGIVEVGVTRPSVAAVAATSGTRSNGGVALAGLIGMAIGGAGVGLVLVRRRSGGQQP